MGRFVSTGVIPEAVYERSNPVRQLFKKILAGRTEPFTREEIEDIVNRRYFGFDSLVSLSKKEETFLRRDMMETLLYYCNEGTVSDFLKSDCYWGEHRNVDGFPHVYTEEALKRSGVSSGVLVTAQEKLNLIERPESLLCARWHESCSETGFTRMGYRGIDEYAIRDKSFTDTVRRLQADSGKKGLHVLDLGGGIGRASHDVKMMHPELITYNATRDEEFCHYPADFHIVGFMERMPRALKGKIDFIFSNMTTRYLAYTDLVVQCCVLMLAKGGVMDVFFSSDRSDNRDEEDVERRMKKGYEYLKDLERSEVIQLEIDHRFSTNAGGLFESDPESLYPAASVLVKKL